MGVNAVSGFYFVAVGCACSTSATRLASAETGKGFCKSRAPIWRKRATLSESTSAPVIKMKRGIFAGRCARSFSKKTSPLAPLRLKSHNTTSQSPDAKKSKAASAVAASCTVMPLAASPSQAISRMLSSSSTTKTEWRARPLTPAPRARCPSSSTGPASETGKMTRMHAPAPPAPAPTLMSPPCSFTTAKAMVRPRPLPPPGRFVVKNGSKILSRLQAGMPGPSSVKEMQIEDPIDSAEMVIEPDPRPEAMDCSALVIMF